MQIIDLAEARKDRVPHCFGQAVCIDCKHEWTATVPDGSVWLKCPSCSLVKGRFIGHHTVSNRWVCYCGCDLFYVTQEGFYCPNCGVEARGF